MCFYALMIEKLKMAIVDIKKVFLATSLILGSAALAQKYEVKDIRIEGLEQINPGAVFTTLGLDPDAPVQRGTVKEIVEKLYSTGLFKDVVVKTQNGRILGRTVPKSVTVEVAVEKEPSTVRGGGAFGNIRTESNEPEIEYVYQEIPCSMAAGHPGCQPVETTVRTDLVIELEEYPVLSRVSFSGNKDLKDKQLNEIIGAANLKPGETLRESTISSAKNNLLKAYETRGKYAINIEPKVIELPRNRAEVQFDISEGRTGQIKKINFTGNNSVSDSKLLRQMRVRESSFRTIFSSGDRYDPYTIQDELDKVQEYYRNNGYLKAEVNYSSATISPSQDTIYLDIDINEGRQYEFGDSTNIVGNFPSVEKEELMSLITIEPGSLYRVNTVNNSVKAIQDRLGNEGYAQAKVNAIPRIDEETGIVNYSFAIDQGERVYVNRINIEGNERTRDEVFRRELRQMEGGRFVASDIERSRVRIQRLAHVEDVQVATEPVSDGLVDLTYKVKERSAGSITFGLSYGMDSKFGINAGFNQPNFMGTGHELNVAAETNKSGSFYNIDYVNPYFTKDGLSAGVSLGYSKQKHDYDDTGNYVADGLSLMFNFGYPLSEYSALRAGIGYERLTLKTTYSSPQEIVDEIAALGKYDLKNGFAPNDQIYRAKLNLYRANIGYYHDTRNRSVFASDGAINSATLSGTLPGSDSKFYKVILQHQSYYPLTDTEDYVFSIRGDAMAGWGYGGTKGLPFFENFYAGGLGSVRGYRASSIGPKFANGDSKGGALRYNATAELIMKVPGFQDNNDVRWSVFVDAGNVAEKPSRPEFGDTAYSAGISFVWLSPLGPLAFSYAQPFKVKDGDREQKFQFSIGIPY